MFSHENDSFCDLKWVSFASFPPKKWFCHFNCAPCSCAPFSNGFQWILTELNKFKINKSHQSIKIPTLIYRMKKSEIFQMGTFRPQGYFSIQFKIIDGEKSKIESVKPINYSKFTIRFLNNLFRFVFNRQMIEKLKFNVIFFSVNWKRLAFFDIFFKLY